jgi:hypothetical protein
MRPRHLPQIIPTNHIPPSNRQIAPEADPLACGSPSNAQGLYILKDFKLPGGGKNYEPRSLRSLAIVRSESNRLFPSTTRRAGVTVND